MPQSNDDGQLQRIWAALPAPADHVDEAAWELFACGELDGAARQRLIDHVTRCADCAQTYRAIVALAAEARILDPSLPSPALAAEAAPATVIPLASRRRAGTWWAASAALAAAAALALFIGWPRGGGDGPDVVRGTGGDIIELAMPAPARASWPAVEGADAYRVSVFTQDGRVAWTATAPATEASWPAPTPGSYLFSVEALRAGSPIARSRLTPFVVPR